MIEVKQLPPDLRALASVIELREEAFPNIMSHFQAIQDSNPGSIHVAALTDNRALSAVRLTPLPQVPNVFNVDRMVTTRAFQGLGLGSLVLVKAQTLAEARGAVMFSLSATRSAVPFYEKLGYRHIGDLCMVKEVM